MREITTSELACMEVITLCDGGKLGYPTAVALCPEDGKITALIIPKDCGLFSFAKAEHYRIPWCRVECLGEDAILVKLTAAELQGCLRKGSGKKK